MLFLRSLRKVRLPIIKIREESDCHAVETYFKGYEYKTITYPISVSAKPHKSRIIYPLSGDIAARISIMTESEAVYCFALLITQQQGREKPSRAA